MAFGQIHETVTICRGSNTLSCCHETKYIKKGKYFRPKGETSMYGTWENPKVIRSMFPEIQARAVSCNLNETLPCVSGLYAPDLTAEIKETLEAGEGHLKLMKS